MDYNKILDATLSVFVECNIKSFPIDCFDILDHYRISLFSYSSLDKELREFCLKFSDDAYHFKDKIFFNDRMPAGRIRFSLMHELGHILLNHGEDHTPDMEQEANCFSSNLLAPRMAIHYAKCKSEKQVSNLFSITKEAALYAFYDYKQWYQWTVYHKMSGFDKQMYSHFYDERFGKFIYSIERCVYCNEEMYNSKDIKCNKCTSPRYIYQPQENFDFLIAEANWLYGGL